VGGAEGTDPGLIALHGCQIVNTGVFQKFAYTFHLLDLLLFDDYSHYSTMNGEKL
jgi:hypothetical protein